MTVRATMVQERARRGSVTRRCCAAALVLWLVACASPVVAPISAAPQRSGEPIEVPASSAEGFHFPYLLLMPGHAASAPFLLVESNNTQTLSDDLGVHRAAALRTITGASVGSDLARRLGLPLLVPIFPRPESAPLMYTHALDRDTLLLESGPLRRLDLQLLAMVDDAREKLLAQGLTVSSQILLSGFSASGTFAQRFTLLHPTRVRAAAYGGINGVLTLPLERHDGRELPYPVGVQDLPELTGAPFASQAWALVPQYVYMGAKDNNDAVAFADGYSAEERRTIHELLGERMMPERWQAVQALYRASGARVEFRTYADRGHGTDGAMHQDIEQFFRGVLSGPSATSVE